MPNFKSLGGSAEAVGMTTDGRTDGTSRKIEFLAPPARGSSLSYQLLYIFGKVMKIPIVQIAKCANRTCFVVTGAIKGIFQSEANAITSALSPGS